MSRFFLSIVLYLTLTLVLFAQQDLRIDYQVDNTTLEQIFTDLESEYGIRFSYASESVEDIIVNAQIEDASLEELLNYLLDDQPIEYKIVENNVLLRKSEDYVSVHTPNYNAGFHLKGKVRQESNFEQIEFASIYISNSSIGTYTDENGNFDIEIPSAYMDENLIIHSLGFEDQVYEIQNLEHEFLLASLTNGSISIDEVMIVNKEKSIRIRSLDNSLGLSKSQIQNSTSGVVGSDLSRQLQLLPGVTATDDASADIKIRGSNSDETLVILDGMPIYNASHYYGIFSSINTGYLDAVNLYKNNFPIHYGGKTAGVVELLSSKDIPEQVKLDADINLLNASIVTVIPLSHKVAFSLAGRTTYSNVSNSGFTSFVSRPDPNISVQNFIDDIPNNVTDPEFSFRDINAKLIFDFDDRHYMDLNWYSSADQYSNGFSRIIRGPINKRIALENVEGEDWSTTAGSINYKFNISQNWQWTHSLYFTKYTNTAFSDSKLKQLINQDDEFTRFGFKQNNQLLDLGSDTQVSLTHGKQKYCFGLGFVRHDISFLLEENNRVNLQDDMVVYELSPYVSHEWMVHDQWSIKTGIRSTLYSATNNFYFSPRVLVNYAVNDQWKFKASYSINQQFVREFDYEYLGETKSLWVSAKGAEFPILQAQNLMFGGSARLGPLLFDLEFYSKNMTGVLEYAITNPSQNLEPDMPRDYQLFSGDGLARGIDLLISSGHENWDTYLSYTLSETTYSFDEIARGASFPSEDDRRHQLKWVNEFGYQKFSFGANWVYSSGRPYTDVRKANDIRNSKPEERFKKLPAYSRVDVGVNYHFKFSKYNGSFGVSLFNAFNHQNLKYLQTVVSTRQENGNNINTILGNETNLLSRTLNLNFKIGI